MIEEFRKICYNRHIKGELKYGKWLPDTKSCSDWIGEMIEEIADFHNYSEYLGARLLEIKKKLIEK